MEEKTENDVKESVEMINERMQILKGIQRLVDQEIERASDTAFSDSDMEIDAYVSTNQAYNAALVILDMAYTVYHFIGDWSRIRCSMFNMAVEIINDCDDAYMHKSKLIEIYSNAMETIKKIYEDEKKKWPYDESMPGSVAKKILWDKLNANREEGSNGPEA